MTEKEREEFNAIVSAEADFYQHSYLSGILKYTTPENAPVMERCSVPAVCRLWKKANA